MWNVTICSPPPPRNHPSASPHPTRPRVPLTPFSRECQSLAGRWLFKPCQIRRVMMSNMPATPETRLTVARPGCTGSYVSLSFPSSPVTHPHPATHSAQSEELRGCRERDCLPFFFICLHIKVLISCLLFCARLRVLPSVALLLFSSSAGLLNGQPRIRGPSGVTFFIVERHNQ